MRGIDRYFERYYAKGPRRRPVRIEFCEADVLDVFDDWRRALGITALDSVGATHASPETPASPLRDERRHESLPAHLERVVTRLTALRAGEDRSLDATLDEIVYEIDLARSGAKAIRGDARQTLIERLRTLDRRLLDVAHAQCDAQTMQAFMAEADADLAPFRGRMTPETYEQSRRAAVDRLLRERRKLPIVAFE
jgi:hypothetical protein